MILIGQYDSPFVRRVGIALTLYGLAFTHQPWSVFNDGAKLQAINPLMRVPTLVLDDGLALTDSHMMLDYLDGMVSTPMFPRDPPIRHRALRVAAMATGLAEKAVSLFYEHRLHATVSPVWDARCRSQIAQVLVWLEAERAGQSQPFWFGAQIGHADIAIACALRFLNDAHPGLFGAQDHPALARHCEQLEAMAVFQAIAQPFVAPA